MLRTVVYQIQLDLEIHRVRRMKSLSTAQCQVCSAEDSLCPAVNRLIHRGTQGNDECSVLP